MCVPISDGGQSSRPRGPFQVQRPCRQTALAAIITVAVVTDRRAGSGLTVGRPIPSGDARARAASMPSRNPIRP